MVWVLYPDCLGLGLDSHWHLNLENLLNLCTPQLFFSKLGVLIVQNPYEQCLMPSRCPENIRQSYYREQNVPTVQTLAICHLFSSHFFQ